MHRAHTDKLNKEEKRTIWDEIMLTLPSDINIYLAREAVDMRKSINGLTVLVANEFHCDPKQSALFVFFNWVRGSNFQLSQQTH